MKHLTLQLDNLDDRDGCVMVTLCGPGAAVFAKHDQSFGGAHWEFTDGDKFAYCMPADTTELEAEAEKLTGTHILECGVFKIEVDTSEYTPPDC